MLAPDICNHRSKSDPMAVLFECKDQGGPWAEVGVIAVMGAWDLVRAVAWLGAWLVRGVACPANPRLTSDRATQGNDTIRYCSYSGCGCLWIFRWQYFSTHPDKPTFLWLGTSRGAQLGVNKGHSLNT